MVSPCLPLILRLHVFEEASDADWADREESKHAHEHGFHRWQEGYNIRELVLEWGHLHLCMIQVINEYEREHLTVDREAIYLSRTAIGQLMNAGISQSVIEYHRLQQAEAGEIVQGLAESLQQLSGWEQQRGQVLREAVHDLRGNLWAVQAATDVLNIVTRPDADSSRQDEIINVLQRGTLTLHRMLTDLLDLARLEAGQEVRKIRQLDVASVLRELCETHEAIAQSKELYLVSDGLETLIVESDAILLQRITQNLMLNAIKYTFKGGISVRWCQKDPHTWTLIVEDTGPGILTSEKSPVLHELVEHEAPEQGEISGIPEQPSQVSGGEGVGIAIVKRLCELLEAKLKVSTSQEQGTCFQITFPTSY